MNANSILIVSPDLAFRDLLAEALAGEYELVSQEGRREARAYLERSRPKAFMIDPTLRGPADEDALRFARRIHPDLPVALIADTAEAGCFSFLKLYGVGAAIPPGLGISPAHLRLFLQHLMEPRSLFNFDRYVFGDQAVSSKRITTSDMRLDALDLLMSDFESCSSVSMHDLQLVFEEILNNAILHAFRTEEDNPKYLGGKDESFDIEDHVVLEWAVGGEYGAVSVTDNQGVLSRRRIWDRFIRQISLTGLLDTSGRGLFLTHLLSQLLLITVLPGKSTRVAVFFGPGSAKRPKPISIQVVPER